MQKSIIIISSALLVLFVFSLCDKNKIENDNPNPDDINEKPVYSLLISKSRKLVSYVISNGTQVTDMTGSYRDCDFEATYTYFADSTYIRHDVCYDFDTEENWFFKNDSSSVYHYTNNGNDTTEYIILILNTSQLKLELIDEDAEEGFYFYFSFE